MRRLTNRALSSTLAATAIVGLIAPTAVAADEHTTPTDDPVEAGAGWLATQLVDGERMESSFGEDTFPDQGLTADVVLALAGAGVAADHIEAATDWLEDQAGAYTGVDWGDVYAGPTAKLALTLVATDRDTTVDDLDLIELLEDREQDNGRFTDDTQDQDGEPADWSSTISQSLAVLALERAEDAAPSQAAIDYLADQQCADGGFPQQLEAEECTPQVDATGFAIEALSLAGETEAAGTAGAWLADVQEDDGGFVGTEGTANANSTGLAAVGLMTVGLDEAAADARAFLLGLQDGCDGPEPGAIRYDDSDTPQVERPRATAQALPGLRGVGFADVDATDARDDVPALECPEPEPEPGPDPEPEFNDLSSENVHYDAIIELARRGVLQGHPDGTYRPADRLTRGQLATVLARAGDVEPVEGERFDDVAGSPHEGAINALAEAAVIEGYPDGTFRPSQAVRRDHVAALIGRWLELEGVEGDRFVDLDDTIHAPLINALADVDVARGDGDGRFHPHRDIRRDQTASLVLRALDVLEADEAR